MSPATGRAPSPSTGRVVLYMSACTNQPSRRRTASCASFLDRATMSGVVFTPSAGAPSFAAAMTLRPSPEPDLDHEVSGRDLAHSISLGTMSGGERHPHDILAGLT